jgi:hypothetical protein
MRGAGGALYNNPNELFATSQLFGAMRVVAAAAQRDIEKAP